MVGLALGALGGGGSVLTVPALTYLLGLSSAVAGTASLDIVAARRSPPCRRTPVTATSDGARGCTSRQAGIGPATLGVALADRIPGPS